jgi:hypothetical protein
METPMKLIITATVLAIMFGSPASAATKSARSAHAQANSGSLALTDTVDGPEGKVIWGGSVRAQDPDWFIRHSIHRGFGSSGGN